MSKFITIFLCPSRRTPEGCPSSVLPVNGPHYTATAEVDKTDYAANGGTSAPVYQTGT